MLEQSLQGILQAGYTPQSFCAEYVEARKSSILIIQFMAAALGLKRVYDDWFPVDCEAQLRRLCREYKLHYKFDWVFEPAQDVSRVISGAGRLPTTNAFGKPFSAQARYAPGACVHVFFARSKRDLELCFRNGWYPLIIANRAVHKPFIDHVRFGYFLGYPDCCVDFFRRYNNHFQYNYLFEALKNTASVPRIFCNPLLKNHTFSYIYHMPCAYDCAGTLRYVGQLHAELARREPELVSRTDAMLARPFLVLGELDTYIFEGRVRDDELAYSDCAFIGSGARLYKHLGEALARGDRVRVEENNVCVFRGWKEILRVRSPFGAFMLQCER